MGSWQVLYGVLDHFLARVEMSDKWLAKRGVVALALWFH